MIWVSLEVAQKKIELKGPHLNNQQSSLNSRIENPFSHQDGRVFCIEMPQILSSLFIRIFIGEEHVKSCGFDG